MIAADELSLRHASQGTLEKFDQPTDASPVIAQRKTIPKKN